MANNRAYLCCRICVEDPDKTWEQSCRFLMKYYPSTGWYVPSETVKTDDGAEVSRIESLNDWLDTHKHGDMYGQYITMVDERADPQQYAKRGIMDAVAGALK